LEAWARAQGLDAAKLKRMNPAFEGGRVLARKDDGAWRVLAPVATAEIAGTATAVGATAAGP
jgi:hypothetical protein